MNNNYEQVIVPLINHWENAQRKCRKLGHREKQESKLLDYGHVQIVYLCPECLAKAQKEHTEIYNKVSKSR